MAGSAAVPYEGVPRLGLYIEADASSLAHAVEYEMPDPRATHRAPTKFVYEDLRPAREEASQEEVTRAAVRRRQHDVDVGSVGGGKDTAVRQLSAEIGEEML